MKERLLNHYMERVEALASLSYAVRSKVGAIVITPNGVTVDGVNGQFPNHSNICEKRVYLINGEVAVSGTHYYDKELNNYYRLETIPSTYHAEQNALAKMLNEGISAKGSTLLVSLSPCMECSKWIARAGIKEVLYKEQYRDTSGIDFLKKCNISVIQYKKVDENA